MQNQSQNIYNARKNVPCLTNSYALLAYSTQQEENEKTSHVWSA